MIGRRGFQNAEPPCASCRPSRPALSFENRRADLEVQRADLAPPDNARAPPGQALDTSFNRPPRMAIRRRKRCWASGGARRPSQTKLHPNRLRNGVSCDFSDYIDSRSLQGARWPF
jgi:hypothetical protein